MVDFSTFNNDNNSVRFEKRMQSTRTAGVRNLYLSGKGIPKRPYYEELPNSSDFISEGNNVKGVLPRTYGGASPAISFIGEWASNSSQVLVYFELGNEDWI